jgi:MSHA biogenesis protein MshP
MTRHLHHRQGGSALLAALFLIIVVAALGIFAMRLGMDQRKAASLELLQLRANTAAHAGLEYWTQRARASNGTIGCSTDSITFLAADRLDGFQVQASCTRIPMGTAVVYEISADAMHGVYGQPDFVRRTARRRVTDLDPANSGWQSTY